MNPYSLSFHHACLPDGAHICLFGLETLHMTSTHHVTLRHRCQCGWCFRCFLQLGFTGANFPLRVQRATSATSSQMFSSPSISVLSWPLLTAFYRPLFASSENTVPYSNN